jgi:hypothetical protein
MHADSGAGEGRCALTRAAWAAILLLCAGAGAGAVPTAEPAPPSPAVAHTAARTVTRTVIVVLENHSASQVFGNGDMPFFNELAAAGAAMTRAGFAQIPYGRVPRGATAPLPARPSQPNYLFLFSGDRQGVAPEYLAFDPPDPAAYPYRGTAMLAANGDLLDAPRHDTPTGIANRMVPAAMRPFHTPNLGAAVIEAGASFACFSESLPFPRFDGDTHNSGSGAYKRKHDPVINWVNLSQRSPAPDVARFVLPEESNLGFAPTVDPVTGARFRGFALDAAGGPLGFGQLPTVSIVVPNQAHDAHDGSLRAADDWLRQNIGPYAAWARDHDGLLILTFDEDGATDSSHGHPNRNGIDRIPTVFYGPMVRPGRYDEPIDHLNVLATVLSLHADLARFRKDFSAAHPGDEGARELANLRPILDVFGRGPALAPLP